MCDFNTDHKTKYDTHLKTIKHLSHNTPMDDKDRLIQSLREEVAYLKGKLEVYEKVGQKEEEEEDVEEYEGSEEDCLIVFNRYRDTFDLDLKDEGTLERLAELRAVDDEVGEVTPDNVLEAFMSNNINFLSHLDVVRAFAEGDDEVISEFIINVLKECKIDIIEKYKGRFKMFYDGKWLNYKDTNEQYEDFITDVYIYFQNCYRAMKFYYGYNHKERELGDYDAIKPLINKLINRFRQVCFIGTDENRKYIINKVSSYK